MTYKYHILYVRNEIYEGLPPTRTLDRNPFTRSYQYQG